MVVLGRAKNTTTQVETLKLSPKNKISLGQKPQIQIPTDQYFDHLLY